MTMQTVLETYLHEADKVSGGPDGGGGGSSPQISGIVLLPDGEPAEGLGVFASQQDGNGFNSTKTGAGGSFIVAAWVGKVCINIDTTDTGTKTGGWLLCIMGRINRVS